MQKLFLKILIVFMLCFPVIGLAETTIGPADSSSSTSPSPSSSATSTQSSNNKTSAVGGLNYGSGVGNTTFTGFQDYVNTIMPWVMKIGYTLALFMLTYAGYKYIVSQGNPEQLSKAKELIISIFIGMALLAMSSYILDIFLQR